MIDQRTGIEIAPSASGLERIALCPGSWEASIPYIANGVRRETHDSERGTRIHAALEIGEYVVLAEEEQAIYRELDGKRQAVLRATFWDNIAEDVLFEKRLTITGAEQKVIFSGQADAIYLSNSSAVIIDYKTGRGEVRKEGNLQMRGLAALAFANFAHLSQVDVAIVQVGKTPIVERYFASNRGELYDWLFWLLDSTKNGEKTPSVEACKYCPAAGNCKEAMAACEEVGDENIELADRLKRVALLKKIANRLEAEAFERLCENPDCIEGVTLEIASPRISDCETVWRRMWLDTNGKLKGGRAVKGANAEAEEAWKKAANALISTQMVERQVWTDKAQAEATLREVLTAAQYRRIAGRVKI